MLWGYNKELLADEEITLRSYFPHLLNNNYRGTGVFNVLFEKTSRVNEVNIPARLAADDLISSFKEAYQEWEDTYRDQLSWDDFRLARKMVRSTPYRVFILELGRKQ